MEPIKENEQTQQEDQQPQGYVERPGWQVWGARLAVVVFVILILFQILSIARGGR